jgi:hypothetical protein
MTIYEKVTNIPFGAILNAPITLLIAGKLLKVAIAYLEKQLELVVEPFAPSGVDEVSNLAEPSCTVSGICNSQDQVKEDA